MVVNAIELNFTELLQNMGWDGQSEGVPQIHGMMSFLKSVRLLLMYLCDVHYETSSTCTLQMFCS